jgi:hypothetical protein
MARTIFCSIVVYLLAFPYDSVLATEIVKEFVRSSLLLASIS